MSNLIKMFTDAYYVRGLPHILFKFRKLISKRQNVFHDPDGIKMHLDIDNYFQNTIRFGYYEYSVRKLMKERLKPGDGMIDLGGNIGYLTCLAGLLVGETGKVIVFEPNPEALKQLYLNLTLNELSNVEVVEAAASDKEGVGTFFLGVESTFSTFVENAPFMLVKKAVEVALTTVDKILIEKKVDAAFFKFVKIDVEGHEYFALRGMQQILNARKASFVVENNVPAQRSTGFNLENILEEFFFPLGYRVYWLQSKDHMSFFYRKKVVKQEITRKNVSSFNHLTGDFLAEPLNT